MAWLRRRRRDSSTVPTAAPALGPTTATAPPRSHVHLLGDEVPHVSSSSPPPPAPVVDDLRRSVDALTATQAEIASRLLRLEQRFDAADRASVTHNHRVDARLDELASAAAGFRAELESAVGYEDLLEVRTHSARVAAELSRLEVNLAARLDVVRERLRALEGDDAAVVDLRGHRDAGQPVPTDTGWPVPLTG